MPFLTTAPAAALRLDRHDGIDEGGGVDHPQGLAEVTTPAGDRGVGQEQLVELALELGRQVARGAAQPYLLRDLGHDLLHVGLGICRQRRLGVAHGASLAQSGCAMAAGTLRSPSLEMSAAWTSMRTRPVTLPGFMTSKVPASSRQS